MINEYMQQLINVIKDDQLEKYEQLERVKDIIDKNPQILNSTIEDGHQKGLSILGLALNSEKNEIAKEIINNHPETLDFIVSEGDFLGFNMLSMAIMFECSIELIKEILDKNPDSRDYSFKCLDEEFNMLALAIRQNQNEIAQELFSRGADLDYIYKLDENSEFNMLALALKEDNPVLAAQMIDSKPGLIDYVINGRELEGMNMLALAIKKGAVDVVNKIILSKPESLNFIPSSGEFENDSMLAIAIKEGKFEILKNLIDSKPEMIDSIASKGENEGLNLLYIAFAEGKTEVAKYLIDKKPELLDFVPDESSELYGVSLLYMAMSGNNADLAKLCLEKKPEWAGLIHNEDVYAGLNMLSIAILEGQPEIAKEIIALNPDSVNFIPEVGDYEGKSMPMLAIEKKNTDLVKLMVEKNPNLIDLVHNDEDSYYDGLSILGLAILLDDLNTAKYLIDTKFELLNFTPEKGESVGLRAIETVILEGTDEFAASFIKEVIKIKPGFLDYVYDSGLNFLCLAIQFNKPAVVNQIIDSIPGSLDFIIDKGKYEGLNLLMLAGAFSSDEIFNKILNVNPQLIDHVLDKGENILEIMYTVKSYIYELTEKLNTIVSHFPQKFDDIIDMEFFPGLNKLVVAILLGQSEIAKKIIEDDPDSINFMPNIGEYARVDMFSLALIKNQTDIAREIKKSKPEAFYQKTLQERLIKSIKNQPESLMEEPTILYQGPVIFESIEDQLNMVSALLELGADPTADDAKSLYYAVKSSNLRMVELLLDNESTKMKLATARDFQLPLDAINPYELREEAIDIAQLLLQIITNKQEIEIDGYDYDSIRESITNSLLDSFTPVQKEAFTLLNMRRTIDEILDESSMVDADLATKYYDSIVLPAFEETFNNLGDNEEENIISLQRVVKEAILTAIVENSSLYIEEGDQERLEFINEHREELLDGVKPVMDEFRKLVQSTDDNYHIAWRAYDPEAPVIEWENLITEDPEIRKKMAIYVLVVQHHHQSELNRLQDELSNLDKNSQEYADLNNELDLLKDQGPDFTNYINQVAGIRRAEGHLQKPGFDNPSCPLGTKGRIGHLGAYTKYVVPPSHRQVINQQVSSAIDTEFRDAKKLISQSDSKKLRKSIIDLNFKTASSILNNEVDFSEELLKWRDSFRSKFVLREQRENLIVQISNKIEEYIPDDKMNHSDFQFLDYKLYDLGNGRQDMLYQLSKTVGDIMDGKIVEDKRIESDVNHAKINPFLGNLNIFPDQRTIYNEVEKYCEYEQLLPVFTEIVNNKDKTKLEVTKEAKELTTKFINKLYIDKERKNNDYVGYSKQILSELGVDNPEIILKNIVNSSFLHGPSNKSVNNLKVKINEHVEYLKGQSLQRSGNPELYSREEKVYNLIKNKTKEFITPKKSSTQSRRLQPVFFSNVSNNTKSSDQKTSDITSIAHKRSKSSPPKLK